MVATAERGTAEETPAARRLVGGGDADARFLPPPEEAFADGLGGEADYLPAEDLEAVGDALIAERGSRLDQLEALRIVYLWKREGGKTRGRLTLGRLAKPSGLLAYFSDADFVVWLAADHLRGLASTAWQVEALLYRQLLHAGIDGNGNPSLVDADFAGFRAELRRYGLWDDALRAMGADVRQLDLPGFVRGERAR